MHNVNVLAYFSAEVGCVTYSGPPLARILADICDESAAELFVAGLLLTRASPMLNS